LTLIKLYTSNKDLAEKTGFSLATIQNFVYAKSRRYEVLNAISNILNFDLEQLSLNSAIDAKNILNSQDDEQIDLHKLDRAVNAIKLILPKYNTFTQKHVTDGLIYTLYKHILSNKNISEKEILDFTKGMVEHGIYTNVITKRSE